ncbi:HlyD family efflux transporter periplasmic adaptor subunit [Candidatus Parcubacteria bacterium]|nr:HlyD family efflux transporter periplasmic adaptor subunit [Candidatus Parcubacteria bacterium]
MRAFADIIPARYVLLGILIAAGMFGLGWWQKKRSSPVAYITASVELAAVRRTVVAEGHVVATTDLPLSFSIPGTLRRLTVREGDHVVREGQVLAELENSKLRSELLDAQAAVKSAQAKLAVLRRGSAAEDVALAEATLERTRQELQSAKANLEAVRVAQTAATAKARRAYLGDPSSAKPSTANTSTAIPVVSGIHTGTVEGSYRVKIVSSSFYDVSGLETATAIPISRIAPTPVGTAGVAIQFSVVGTIATGDEWTIDVPDVSRSDNTERLRAYQAAVAEEEAAVANAKAAVDVQTAILHEAEARVARLKTPVRPEEVIAAEAVVLGARANAVRAESEFAKTFIRAPVAGVIMSVARAAGQFLAAATPVLTILDVRERQVSAEASWSGDASPQPNQEVLVRFPQVTGEQVFTQKVLAVNSAQSGLYSLNVSVPDRRDVALGTLAVVSLELEKPKAVAVPNAAVTENGNGHTVLVVGKQGAYERAVEVGLVGDELTEILSGLILGEGVAIAPREDGP